MRLAGVDGLLAIDETTGCLWLTRDKLRTPVLLEGSYRVDFDSEPRRILNGRGETAAVERMPVSLAGGFVQDSVRSCPVAGNAFQGRLIADVSGQPAPKN